MFTPKRKSWNTCCWSFLPSFFPIVSHCLHCSQCANAGVFLPRVGCSRNIHPYVVGKDEKSQCNMKTRQENFVDFWRRNNIFVLVPRRDTSQNYCFERLRVHGVWNLGFKFCELALFKKPKIFYWLFILDSHCRISRIKKMFLFFMLDRWKIEQAAQILFWFFKKHFFLLQEQKYFSSSTENMLTLRTNKGTYEENTFTKYSSVSM